MIHVIVQLFSTISNGFYYLFWTSYLIGKCLSWIFCSILDVLSYIWCNALEAGTVFSEDFFIFAKDLVEVIATVTDAGKDSIRTSFVFLYSIVRVTVTTIMDVFTTGNLHTANVGQQFINSFAAMMNALKNLFVIIGNGMWFIMTLVPTLLISIIAFIHQISKFCVRACLDFGEAVWLNVKEITSASVNYFLDVPLQALIGCSFIALLVIYRQVTLTFITWLVIRLVQYLRSRLVTAFVAILSSFRRRTNNNRSRMSQQPCSRSSTNRSSTVSPFKPPPTDENVCVICRDEQRNIVLMPCKHMCLCCGCSGSVRTCPLCRRPIKDFIRVYT